MQKKHQERFSKLKFNENITLAKTTRIAYEQYKFVNRSQEPVEILETFHAALTAQEAKSALDTLEDELVRDLFISKMGSPALQDNHTFGTLPTDEVLKRALKFEQSKQTTPAFQKPNINAA